MRAKKEATICVDFRWIDSSSAGVYVKGIMPGIVESLGDVSIIGIGDCSRLEDFCLGVRLSKARRREGSCLSGGSGYAAAWKRWSRPRDVPF